MKKFFLSLSLALASTLAFAQEAEQNPNAAEIKFEQEVIDYGTIDKGANGQREFTFVNTGKEPLIITKATGSCGCTVPQWPRNPIAPGEEGVIKVKYDTKRVGPFQKSVTVNSNAKNGTKVLRIKGTVKQVEQVQTSPENKEKSSVMDRS